MIAVEKRVVSTMGFRQEADGRGVASKAAEKKDKQGAARKRASRMNDCP